MVDEYETEGEDCYYDEAGRWVDLRTSSIENEEASGDLSQVGVDDVAETEAQSRVSDPGGA